MLFLLLGLSAPKDRADHYSNTDYFHSICSNQSLSSFVNATFVGLQDLAYSDTSLGARTAELAILRLHLGMNNKRSWATELPLRKSMMDSHIELDMTLFKCVRALSGVREASLLLKSSPTDYLDKTLVRFRDLTGIDDQVGIMRSKNAEFVPSRRVSDTISLSIDPFQDLLHQLRDRIDDS